MLAVAFCRLFHNFDSMSELGELLRVILAFGAETLHFLIKRQIAKNLSADPDLLNLKTQR